MKYNKQIQIPQLLSSIQLESTPLKSIIYNNELITITDNYSYQSTSVLSSGELQFKTKQSLRPTVSSFASTSHGILIHHHSQPIQLVKELKTKPIQSYQPLPSSNCIFHPMNDNFSSFHSSSLFKYSFDDHEPIQQKKLKIGTVSCIEHYGWNSFILCSTYQGKIVLLDGEEMNIIQTIDLKKEITQINMFNENYLLVATRKDDRMYVFDIRQMESPVALFSRSAKTNQRIGYSIHQNTLITGNDNGCIYLYDLKTFQFKHSFQLSYSSINDIFVHNSNTLIITTGCRPLPFENSLDSFQSNQLTNKQFSPSQYNMISSWNYSFDNC